jgi:hypothetical protein
MGAYKPTGRPPGRPPKVRVDVEKPSDVDNPDVVRIPGTTGPAAPVEEPPPADEKKPLKRAHKGFRRSLPNPADELHHPPRFSKERRHLGSRPILHPNVIKGA